MMPAAIRGQPNRLNVRIRPGLITSSDVSPFHGFFPLFAKKVE
jgi:hypothetical protein